MPNSKFPLAQYSVPMTAGGGGGGEREKSGGQFGQAFEYGCMQYRAAGEDVALVDK